MGNKVDIVGNKIEYRKVRKRKELESKIFQGLRRTGLFLWLSVCGLGNL